MTCATYNLQPHSVSSRLTCARLSALALVLHDAVVMPEGSTVVTKEGKLEASCNALSSLQTQTVWLKVRTLHMVQFIYFSDTCNLEIQKSCVHLSLGHQRPPKLVAGVLTMAVSQFNVSMLVASLT